MNLVPAPFLKYERSKASGLRYRSVNNVLNCRPHHHHSSSTTTTTAFLLSDVYPRGKAISEINSVLRLMNNKSIDDGSHHLIEMRCLKKLLNSVRSYCPFQIIHWDDFSKCRVALYFISIRDESRYQAVDTSGTFARDNGGDSRLNEDNDFELRQNIHAALFNDLLIDEEVTNNYRKQFNTISKDFISSERQHFDLQNGLLYQGLTRMLIIDSIQQKWWSLFGKYWIVENDKNDDDMKKMKWLMTGGNHGTTDVWRKCIIDL